MLSRRIVLTFLAAAPATAFLASRVRADTPPIYSEGGIALGGTDPVAYFTEGRPVSGSAEHEVVWGGATWRFATAEHRAAFEANPDAYAPQYGGWCAWAVAEGYTASTVQNAWRIVDGKLYLNFSRGVQRRWERDIPGNILRADANWPAVLQK